MTADELQAKACPNTLTTSYLSVGCSEAVAGVDHVDLLNGRCEFEDASVGPGQLVGMPSYAAGVFVVDGDEWHAVAGAILVPTDAGPTTVALP